MCKNNITVVWERFYNPPAGCLTNEPIKVMRMSNGECHVPFEEYDKIIPCIHVTGKGDSKTGDGVQSLSTPINETCDHSFECFYDGTCYGCGGEFTHYPNTAIRYAETLKAYIEWDVDRIADEIERQIKKSTTMFRFSVIGDLTPKSLEAMVILSKRLLSAGRDIHFYTYTKKYSLVNAYVKKHGDSKAIAIPSNFEVLFSEWKGHKMDNPYGFRLSRFVPFEEKDNIQLEEGALICPCSFTEWAGTCEECRQCPEGEGNVYLVEHSTAKSAKHDKEVHAKQKTLKDKKKELKALLRATKKAGGETYSKAMQAWEMFRTEHIDRFIKKG